MNTAQMVDNLNKVYDALVRLDASQSELDVLNNVIAELCKRGMREMGEG